MAKKKKLHKKQQRQHKQSFAKSSSTHRAEDATGGLSQATSAPVQAMAAAAVVRPGATFGYVVENLDLIRKDVRKVIFLATAFVLVQVLLWILFEHTGLGSAVYGFVKF